MAMRYPFLCSYGGGHAKIIAALSHELTRRGVHHDVMGFTTAVAALRQSGIEARTVSDLLDPKADAPFIEQARRVAPRADHPDITDTETLAYYAVGYRDLSDRFGEHEALRRVAEFGRKAFEPISAFRRLFAACRPSVVVTTTSPRYELAAIKAAHSLSIPTIAVGDMFLVAEQEWILREPYADHLVILSDQVGRMLRENGLSSATRLHVLGNPAFDDLAARPGDAERRVRLREALGVEGHTLILWPLGGAPEMVAGRAMLAAHEAGRMLDAICDQTPRYRYLLRPHPNWPVPNLPLKHGAIERDLTVEDALLVADLVCVEASTMGLQAVLKGKPVICCNFADYVLYPGFGWASAVSNEKELEEVLLSGAFFAPPAKTCEKVGDATASVTQLIVDVAGDAGDKCE
jgi:hypothetical protein